MGLILRVPHYPLPSGATVSLTKLTLQQMDENFIFLQNLISGLTPLTVSEVVDLKNNSQIVIGQAYLITDADPTLYGSDSPFNFGDGTNIILRGISENSFSSNGYGKFYNPKYSDYNVYNSHDTYVEGNVVIYGGKVWQRLADGNEGIVDYWDLDTAWSVIEYTNPTYYNVVWDEIEYDFDNNFICSRYDALNNNLVKNNYDVQYFNCELWPIQGFRWGHNINDGGVANCTIINSYFGCLNYVSGYIYNINYANNSISSNINLYDNSGLYNVNLQNYCSLNSIYLWNSSISDIKMENNSYMNDIYLNDNNNINTDCYLYNISLMNNSYFQNIYLEPTNTDCSVYISGVSLTNYCSINYVYLESDNDDCYFEDVNITNDSDMANISAIDSQFSNIEINTDSLLAGNYDHTFATATKFSYITLTNQSSIMGDYDSDDDTGDGIIHFDSSTFEYVNLSNYSIFTGPFEMNTNSSIANLKMDYGYFGGRDQNSGDSSFIYMENSEIDNILIDRYSWISNLEMHYSNIYNSKISNYSRISSNGGTYSSILLTNNSTLDYINLNNHSYIGYDRIEINGSNWYDVTLENDSKIGGYISFSASQFGIISLKNNSKFWGDSEQILIESSDIHYVNMDNRSEITGYMEIYDSTVQQIEMNGGYWGGFNNNNFYLHGNSYFQWISILNGSSIVSDHGDITINNSTMKYINLNNNSYIDGYLNVNSGAIIEYLELTNESYFNSNSNMWIYQNSLVSNIKISNNSYIAGYMDLGEGSIFKNINVDNSSHIEGSLYIYANTTEPYENGSEFSNINITNNSYISGSIFIGQNESDPGIIGKGTITGLNISNNSYFSDYISVKYLSTMQNININNSSYITGNIYLSNETNFENIIIDNESYMSGFFAMENFSTFKDINILNGSHIGNNLAGIQIYDSATVEYITVKNYSKITSLYLQGSGTKFYYVDLNNYSYIDPDINNYGNDYYASYLYMDNASEIKYLELDNHSHINQRLRMGDGSSALLKRVKLANYSKMSGWNYMSGSEIQYVSMINVSNDSVTTQNPSCYGPGFTNFYLQDSVLHGLNMEWSTFGGIYMYQSILKGLTIENSTVLNVGVDNNSGFYNSKIYNSYVDGWGPGGIYIQNNSNVENLIIDTTDFPTWNSDYYFGLYVGNDSFVRNMNLKNLSLVDRIDIRANNDPSNGLFQNFNVNNLSYVENFTIDGGETFDGGSYGWSAYLTDVDVINEAYISNFNALNAQIDTISLDGANHLFNIDIKNSSFADVNLRNNSFIENVNIINSNDQVYTIYLDDSVPSINASFISNLNINNSNFYNIYLDIDSIMTGVNINDSVVYNINLNNNSILSGLDLKNFSFIDNISFTQSQFSLTTLNFSSLDQINAENSILFNNNLSGSVLEYYNPIGITQSNVSLTNVYFNYNSATNSTLSDTLAHGNTIKYQFTVNLSNVNGTIDIPTVLIPSSGWYFEKVLFDTTALVSSGTSSLSMGMVSHPECALNDVDLSVLSNRVKLYDLNNFATPGAKSTNIDKLTMFTNGDTITSGTMSVEVTFKNTAYSVNWFY